MPINLIYYFNNTKKNSQNNFFNDYCSSCFIHKVIKGWWIYTYVLSLNKNLLKRNIKSYWRTTNQRDDDYDPKFFESIKILNPDIIHIHGLWRKPTRIIKKLSKITKNIIVSPHGMLNKELFNQSKNSRNKYLCFCSKKEI